MGKDERPKPMAGRAPARTLVKPGAILGRPADAATQADAKRADARKAEAQRFGLSAESKAAVLLLAKGHRILARRWRSGHGEIDIVAVRGRTLVFVEVKARGRLDDAAEAVVPRQRRRIVTAAEAWLAGHPEHAGYDIRFDAVLVAPGRVPRHIPNAFDADG